MIDDIEFVNEDKDYDAEWEGARGADDDIANSDGSDGLEHCVDHANYHCETDVSSRSMESTG
eukprot:CAMPEP_0172480888 /NCGR_PEP_ID=MMETSP1066-20121228/6409_1 /TAXON_ID=671091 /ORGANISM="Coscinodiscus wailesii, Strain CCMP2513" /LENGTH=61 /DNA_ID=CAMNT_0013242685 /DNA_START=42 /DNA_END=223 /DNA_ORIENTATION=-